MNYDGLRRTGYSIPGVYSDNEGAVGRPLLKAISPAQSDRLIMMLSADDAVVPRSRPGR